MVRKCFWALTVGLLGFLGQASAETATNLCAVLAGSYNEPAIEQDRGVYFPQIDVDAASLACAAAMEDGRTPETLFRMARVLTKQGDPEGARLVAEEASNAGYPPAMALTSYYWLVGIGGEARPKEGLELALKAEALGDATGSFYVATAYQYGLSVPADPVAASRGYERGVKGGDC